MMENSYAFAKEDVKRQLHKNPEKAYFMRFSGFFAKK